jgi:hypothetical protein
MFLRKSSEREKLENLLNSTRVEEVWRVVGEKAFWCPKQSFLIYLSQLKKHLLREIA